MSADYFASSLDVRRLIVPAIDELRERRTRDGCGLQEARRAIIHERLEALLDGDEGESVPPYPELTTNDLRKVMLFMLREKYR